MNSRWMSAARRLGAATVFSLGVTAAASAADGPWDYKVVSTTKTSTAQKEMTEAAEQGYRFMGVMGGETAFGGKEVVVIMAKPQGVTAGRFSYRLLATTKTSTMQRELQESVDLGFAYADQTVFESAFGGKEVVVILERDKDAKTQSYDLRLLATSKTSTMQKEIALAGQAGWEYVGMTVGGSELVVILQKPRGQ